MFNPDDLAEYARQFDENVLHMLKHAAELDPDPVELAEFARKHDEDLRNMLEQMNLAELDRSR